MRHLLPGEVATLDPDDSAVDHADCECEAATMHLVVCRCAVRSGEERHIQSLGYDGLNAAADVT